VVSGKITREAAREVARDRTELEKLIAGEGGRYAGATPGTRFSDLPAM
jgi:hypothetical protein